MSQICPKCQSTNIDTAKFCKKCGNALQPSALGGQTLSAIEQRALEEKLYEQVAIELKNGQRKEGLYTKALVDANGSEELANVLYIKYAVQSLQDELMLQAEQERVIKDNEDREMALQKQLIRDEEKIKAEKISALEEETNKISLYLLLGLVVVGSLIFFAVAIITSVV